VADLLERGADVDERDASGRTAVTAAVYAGSARPFVCSSTPERT
jgi:hypothetical protein